MRSDTLKIKRLSLAAESRILRQQIRRAFKKGQFATAGRYQGHLAKVVRPATRAAGLAHCFLRGKAAWSADRSEREPDFDQIAKNVRTFGGGAYKGTEAEDVKVWYREPAPVPDQLALPNVSLIDRVFDFIIRV